MREFERQKGIAFILLSFTGKNEVYYLPFDHIAFFWDRMEKGGRKSFTYQEIDRSYAVRAHRDMLIHYLEPLKKDLERKDLVDK